MHTIQLKISDKVYDKFIWLLNKFSKDEVEIVENDSNFYANKQYIENQLKEINEGRATYLSQEEFEKRLDDII